MIKSMTGYGKADFQTTRYKIEIEIKSVNHRFCEISFQNFPQELRSLDFKLRKMISKRFARGHFYLFLRLLPLAGEGVAGDFLLDEVSLRSCLQALSRMKDELGLKEDITISHLLFFKDLFFQKSVAVDFKSVEERIDPLLNKAMDELESMRKAEGASLASGLFSHLTLIRNEISEIERFRESVIQNYKNRLFKKINELKSDITLEPQRIAYEVALFSDRMDIQEEIDRLGSHIHQFEQMIQEDKPVGRSMDFLIQEMNREINTIGSKTGSTKSTIFIKQELEILREQVQNVE